jgi:methylenetetrahydrofolate--tRNA-(uracil-5-)-methyltransferase
MNANFGLWPPAGKKIRNKKERYEFLAERSLTALKNIIETQNL